MPYKSPHDLSGSETQRFKQTDLVCLLNRDHNKGIRHAKDGNNRYKHKQNKHHRLLVTERIKQQPVHILPRPDSILRTHRLLHPLPTLFKKKGILCHHINRICPILQTHQLAPHVERGKNKSRIKIPHPHVKDARNRQFLRQVQLVYLRHIARRINEERITQRQPQHAGQVHTHDRIAIIYIKLTDDDTLGNFTDAVSPQRIYTYNDRGCSSSGMLN